LPVLPILSLLYSALHRRSRGRGVVPPFKTAERVSWVDTDAASVMHFSNYFRFFERAEEALYRSLGIDFELVRRRYKIWLPRVEAFCRYESPSRFNDVVEVALTLEEMDRRTIRYGFTVANTTTQRLAAQGYVKIIAADITTRRAATLPDDLAKRIRDALGDPRE